MEEIGDSVPNRPICVQVRAGPLSVTSREFAEVFAACPERSCTHHKHCSHCSCAADAPVWFVTAFPARAYYTRQKCCRRCVEGCSMPCAALRYQFHFGSSMLPRGGGAQGSRRLCSMPPLICACWLCSSASIERAISRGKQPIDLENRMLSLLRRKSSAAVVRKTVFFEASGITSG